MDMSAMKSDLIGVLRTLPKGMVNPVKVAQWLSEHRASLDLFIPSAIAKLMPHISAAGLEGAMGTLDKDEIERACLEALLEYGADLARVEGMDVTAFMNQLKQS